VLLAFLITVHVILAMILVLFILFEPLGLAKIHDNARKYFLVWPFRHGRS
jgi:branched-chain amino acid transport system permease protein